MFLIFFSFSVSRTRISITYPFSDSFLFYDGRLGTQKQQQRWLKAQFNLKMLCDFFFPRFHVRVFDSGTYLLSAVVVNSFFEIDLPSFSRLKSVFGKGRMKQKQHSCQLAVVCESEKKFSWNFHLWLWKFAVKLSRRSSLVVDEINSDFLSFFCFLFRPVHPATYTTNTIRKRSNATNPSEPASLPKTISETTRNFHRVEQVCLFKKNDKTVVLRHFEELKLIWFNCDESILPQAMWNWIFRRLFVC